MSNDRVVEYQSEHFDCSTCVVEGLGQEVVDALGCGIENDLLIGLIGAPTKSKIRVVVKWEWSEEEIPDGEDVPPGILFLVENDKYFDEPAEVVVFLDGLRDKIGVYLKLIVFKDDPALKGLAGHMIHVMAEAALKIPGTSRLKLWAAGGLLWDDMSPGVRWGGYFAWPKYGFDCIVPSPTRALFAHFPYYPAGLASCLKVSDVLSLVGGRDFWKIAGEGSYMNFDLAKNSKSRETLGKFLQDWRKI
ncbi:hypothetical protein KWH03_20330 [Xanthomonas campestris pv. lawsoniae]|uniref:hypothetical protein n=1 Tax=Xanthomonas euvesicatoria TaxID=456327 RepID=UPI001C48D27C|nr:hypothetical protein [Xanthomonas euvesicatoria]MBV6803981.1 hypothetical protein [Xanthomonas campestris pv. lawsoniae]